MLNESGTKNIRFIAANLLHIIIAHLRSSTSWHRSNASCIPQRKSTLADETNLKKTMLEDDSWNRHWRRMIDRIARCWLESKNNATLFELAQKNLLVHMDSLAERSKAVAQGAVPKGRGFEPHSCHFDSRELCLHGHCNNWRVWGRLQATCLCR